MAKKPVKPAPKPKSSTMPKKPLNDKRNMTASKSPFGMGSKGMIGKSC